jgi:hypothetical protein
MAAEIKNVVCITMPGLRSQWLVNQEQMLETKDGAFVCVDPLNVGLRNIVMEENPSVMNKRTSIREMKGYAMLRDMRNKAMMVASETDSAGSCSLFDAPAEPDVAKKQKRRKKRPAADDEPMTVQFDVIIDDTVYKVVALETRSFASKVYVASTPENVHAVITLLRNGGVGAQLRKARDQALPRGVWQRGERFMVHKPDGSQKYKLVDSVEEAQVFLAGASGDEEQVADEDTGSPTAENVEE